MSDPPQITARVSDNDIIFFQKIRVHSSLLKQVLRPNKIENAKEELLELSKANFILSMRNWEAFFSITHRKGYCQRLEIRVSDPQFVFTEPGSMTMKNSFSDVTPFFLRIRTKR